MDIAKWRDGSDRICSECGEPIYTVQPMVGTITQVPKKRHCRHFLCSPNASITLIGNGKVNVFKGNTSPNGEPLSSPTKVGVSSGETI